MNDNKFSMKLSLVFITVISLVLILIGISAYRSSLEFNLSASNCITLDSIIDQQKFAFSSKLQNQKNIIKTYANFFAYGEFSDADVLEELNEIKKDSDFSYISFAMPTGETIENTGNRLNVSDRDYFVRALNGETVISNPIQSKVTWNSIIVFASPIYEQGKIVAILIGIYDTRSLMDLLLPSFDGKGYTYVTTKEGDIIVKTQKLGSLSIFSNLLDVLKPANFYKNDSYDTIQDNINKTKSGHTQFDYDGERRLMHYAPLDINSWYIFVVVPESVIAVQTITIMKNTTLLMIGICVLFILILSYFFQEQRKHIKEISDMAFMDKLTGTHNKNKFKITAANILNYRFERYAFLVLDIDKFKLINDTLGFDKGDLLLICIANVLRDNIRANETFARCDSDEYYLLLEFEYSHAIEIRIQNMINKIENEFKSKIDSDYSLVLCVGIYVTDDPREHIDKIIDKGKYAHNQIKGSQNSSISFYSKEMHHRILKDKSIENKMHKALDNNEFKIYLQPKYYLKTEKIYGAEALVRWYDCDSVIIHPNDFIPIFERNGFITKLDMYMLEMACKTICKWIENSIVPIPISVNFSRRHLRNDNFVDDISDIVNRYHVNPNLIDIELTENTMMNNADTLINVLTKLHEHGFTLSMDDFGSGYSSLGLLKNLSVDTIKLDREFFTQYNDLARAKTVIASVISMAKNLGICTVAEGVETIEHIEMLRDLDCDIVQGYYYAKPIPASEIDRLLI